MYRVICKPDGGSMAFVAKTFDSLEEARAYLKEIQQFEAYGQRYALEEHFNEA